MDLSVGSVVRLFSSSFVGKVTISYIEANEVDVILEKPIDGNDELSVNVSELSPLLDFEVEKNSFEGRIKKLYYNRKGDYSCSEFRDISEQHIYQLILEVEIFGKKNVLANKICFPFPDFRHCCS